MNRPQTNGTERFFRTVGERLPQFDYHAAGLIRWYNCIKPHMNLSLDGRRCDTPAEAFHHKLPW